MRDTYVLILFLFFLASGTFLAHSGKIDPQLMLTPIVTGFLGLLASTKQSPTTSPFSGTLGRILPKSDASKDDKPKDDPKDSTL
ncbi:MAG: hypothetical protein EHM89_13150 [Acidobacteria bacterium]|nr:MAG: hypothetical protein EHM89_13150 [Acidobacteriota bacterium]